MSELIDRHDAIKAIETSRFLVDAKEKVMLLPSSQLEIHFDEWCTDCNEYDHEKHCCPRFNKVIRRTVEELKAQPKTGHWVEFPNHNAYKCSECGRIIETADGKNNVYKHYPYCHCGAKMLKEGETHD